MAFRMKGFTFPGIKTKGYENKEDGRSKSSVFQLKDDPKFTPGNVFRVLRDRYKSTFGKGWRDKYKKKK